MAEPALKREIGIVGAAFIALNGILGSAIFALPADLVAGAGAFSPLLFPLFGLLMIAVALVFADLARGYDATGGPFLYASAAFGPFIGFQAGWLLYVSSAAALAASAHVLITYLAEFFPVLAEDSPRIALLLSLIAVLTAVNLIGVKQAIRTLNVLSVLKLAPLLAFVVWGLVATAPAAPLTITPPDAAGLGALSLLVIYAFVGFERATITAGETADARRALPRALILTLVAMAALYFLIQFVYVAATRGAPVEGAPLVEAARLIAGPAGAVAIAIGAILSISGNVAAIMLSAPRMTYALAQDRILPGWFGAVHARFATPLNSILFFGVLVAALALSGAFVWLAVISALSRMLVYILCALALPVLRRREGAPLAVRTIAAPAITIAVCVWAASNASQNAWLMLFGLVAAGAALFAIGRLAARA